MGIHPERPQRVVEIKYDDFGKWKGVDECRREDCAAGGCWDGR